MSRDAVFDDGGIMGGIKFLQGDLKAAAREAQAWVRDVIAAIKAAPDNLFGDNDEAIAGEILRQIDAKQA
jgi:hypothetical protein